MDDVTGQIVRFVTQTESLPASVMQEARRTFFNIIGCMIGGAHHDMVDIADRALTPFSDSRQAALACRGKRTDILNASLINCLASTVHAFNDTLEGSLVHPSGTSATPALALSELRPVSGKELLNAFALGVEITCRLART